MARDRRGLRHARRWHRYRPHRACLRRGRLTSRTGSSSLVAEPREVELLCAVQPDGNVQARTSAKLQRPLGEGSRPATSIRDLAQREGCSSHEECTATRIPFCWRADTDPLIQLARPAWFIRTTALHGPRDREQPARSTGCPEHIKEGRFGRLPARTTSTGRCRASATGARRSTSGSTTKDSEHRHAPASLAEIEATQPERLRRFTGRAKEKDP